MYNINNELPKNLSIFTEIISTLSKKGERIEIKRPVNMSCFLVHKYFQSEIKKAEQDNNIEKIFDLKKRYAVAKHLKVIYYVKIHTDPIISVYFFSNDTLMIHGKHLEYFDESLEEVLDMLSLPFYAIL